MNKLKDEFLMIINIIASIITILTVIFANIYIAITTLVITLVLLTISFIFKSKKYNELIQNHQNLKKQYDELKEVHDDEINKYNKLEEKYNERCEFIDFIQYLFDNKTHIFNLLPKVCLIVDKYKEYNDLHLRNMSIKYIHDISKIDTSKLTSDDEWITYDTTIEFILNAENKNLPKNYIFFGGNMNAKDKAIITQKHGEQEKYTAISHLNGNEEDISLIVSRHKWALDNKSNNNPFPICFKMEFKEKSKINSFDEIIFYPKKYAKSIDTVNFEIQFKHNKNIFTKAQLFRIEKNQNNQFDTISIEEVSGKNVISFNKLNVDATKYEAYYIKFYWKFI